MPYPTTVTAIEKIAGWLEKYITFPNISELEQHGSTGAEGLLQLLELLNTKETFRQQTSKHTVNEGGMISWVYISVSWCNQKYEDGVCPACMYIVYPRTLHFAHSDQVHRKSWAFIDFARQKNILHGALSEQRLYQRAESFLTLFS